MKEKSTAVCWVSAEEYKKFWQDVPPPKTVIVTGLRGKVIGVISPKEKAE